MCAIFSCYILARHTCIRHALRVCSAFFVAWAASLDGNESRASSALRKYVPCLPHTTNISHTTYHIPQARDGSNNDREFGGDEFEVNVYFMMGDEYAEDDEAGANDQEFDADAAAAEDEAQRSRITVRKARLQTCTFRDLFPYPIDSKQVHSNSRMMLGSVCSNTNKI